MPIVVNPALKEAKLILTLNLSIRLASSVYFKGGLIFFLWRARTLNNFPVPHRRNQLGLAQMKSDMKKYLENGIEKDRKQTGEILTC
jgi:hypothetical protein